MDEKRWTQDQAIAFECARECITDLMGICSTAIADEEAMPARNSGRIQELEKELARLAAERSALTITDQQKIELIRREYGAQVRAYRAKNKKKAA